MYLKCLYYLGIKKSKTDVIIKDYKGLLFIPTPLLWHLICKSLMTWYQVISNQKRLTLLTRIYYKNVYLEIQKPNFCALYVKKFTTICSFRKYICFLQKLPKIILCMVIMLHLWAVAETKILKTELPDFLCSMLFWFLLFFVSIRYVFKTVINRCIFYCTCILQKWQCWQNFPENSFGLLFK